MANDLILRNPNVIYLDEQPAYINYIQGGWTPNLASFYSEGKKYILAKSWMGGYGIPPRSNVYIGENGFTPNLALATPFTEVPTPSDETFLIL